MVFIDGGGGTDSLTIDGLDLGHTVVGLKGGVLHRSGDSGTLIVVKDVERLLVSGAIPPEGGWLQAPKDRAQIVFPSGAVEQTTVVS